MILINKLSQIRSVSSSPIIIEQQHLISEIERVFPSKLPIIVNILIVIIGVLRIFLFHNHEHTIYLIISLNSCEVNLTLIISIKPLI